MDAYKDTSIFQGTLEWHDEEGQAWRAVYLGSQWSVYKLGESGYVRAGLVRARSNASPRKIHQALHDSRGLQ